MPTRARRLLPRWAWLAALCVGLGLMTSIGVAWGWASFGEGYSVATRRRAGPTFPNSESRYRALCFSSRSSWGATEITFTLASQEPDVIDHAIVPTDNTEYARLTRNAACRNALSLHMPLLSSPDWRDVAYAVTLMGWPIRCLSVVDACTADDVRAARVGMQVFSRATGTFVTLAQSEIPVDLAFNLRPHYGAIEIGNTLLPTFPLWPGLLANTACYGGAWAVVIFTPLVARRWLRASKGGCAGCGYSREGLKADAPCPECGRAT